MMDLRPLNYKEQEQISTRSKRVFHAPIFVNMANYTLWQLTEDESQVYPVYGIDKKIVSEVVNAA
jgi:hypothetical protein